MPALFPSWANSVVRAVLVAGVMVVVGVPALSLAWVRSPYATGKGLDVPQPILFDHRHHVRDDGIACAYCHATATRSRAAGMPATSVCLGCHAQILSDSPLLRPVWQSAQTGIPIAWRRVNDLPDFVFFDHGVHAAGGISCESCHGRIDEMAQVRQANSLTMSWCLDCHRKAESIDRAPVAAATAVAAVGRLTTCTACHR